MDPELFRQLSSIASAHQQWKTPPIMVSLFPSLSAVQPNVIDIISTMEHKHLPNRWQSRNQILFGCHWFPPDIGSNSSESRNKILLLLSKPCNDSGFSLITGKVTQHPNKSGLVPLRLVCNRSRQYEKSKKSQHVRRTETSRPKCLSEKCPFGFTIYFDPEVSRWLLPAIQHGCSHHTSHPRLDPLCLTIRKSVVDLDEPEMIFQQLKMNVNPSLVSKLFAERNGTSLSAAQLRKF